MPENREKIFSSPVLVESFVRKYGNKFKDSDLLYDLTEAGKEVSVKKVVKKVSKKKLGKVGKALKYAKNKWKPVGKAIAKNKGKVLVGAALGASAIGAGAYAANKYGSRRPHESVDADTVVAFTKYGVKRFAEAQEAKGVDRKTIVKDIVENLRAGMRAVCPTCYEPAKCRAKLASEIAKMGIV